VAKLNQGLHTPCAGQRLFGGPVRPAGAVAWRTIAHDWFDDSVSIAALAGGTSTA
jgi:hypothetical protein